jgi:hypothetical protein
MKKEISIKYEKSQDFKYIPATGAGGALSPQGEIICNFFIEQIDFPKTGKIIIDQETQEHIEDRDQNENIDITRELQVGVVMRPDIAISVGEWLIREATKAIKSNE